MSAFSQEWLNELTQKSDIVTIISQRVELKQKGGRFWGCCPFHNEKTPSFSVEPQKQMFYCFGCHVGGNVIHYTMQYEKISFIEAVKKLASDAQMTLPDQIYDQKMREEHVVRQKLYLANKEAAKFFYTNIKRANPKIQNYFKDRGIDTKTLVKFGLGYSLDSWDALILYLQEKGFTKREIILSGLAIEKNQKAYDCFRNRIMFPIIDTSQRVIGFGARIVGEGQPKYLNTNDTLVFNKRQNLYGLSDIKMHSDTPLIVVEGYMDVIGLYQHNIKNAIATLGTALTKQQAFLIAKYTKKVYMAYDGDSAGQNATLRSIDVLAQQGLDVFVVEMPKNIDPDEFVRKNGKLAFEELVKKAPPQNEFKLFNIISSFDLKVEHERISCAKKASNFVKTLSPVEQEQYFIKVSQKTGFSVEALQKQAFVDMQNIKNNNYKQNQPNNTPNFRNNTNNTIKQEVTQRNLYETILVKAAAQKQEFSDIAFKNIELFKIDVYKKYIIALQNDFLGALNILDDKDASIIAAALASSECCNDKESFKANIDQIKRIDLLDELEELQKKMYDTQTSQQTRRECLMRISEINSLLIH